MIAGAAVLTCTAIGTAVGVDAAGQVNPSYRTASSIRWRPTPIVTTQAPEWDRFETPIAAAPPPAGTLWGQEIGRDEQAFFEPERVWRDEPPVRVHRATVTAPAEAPLIEPTLNEKADPVDGLVDAPAEASVVGTIG